MSDYESPPPEDADRTITEAEESIDPEAPSDSPLVNPPSEDADRPVPELEELDGHEGELQEENAGTSLDQPSGGNS